MIFLKLGSWLASQKADRNVQLHSRSPHGERGLKSGYGYARIRSVPSLSSRRAWIEMQILEDLTGARAGRSPHGERGLKYTDSVTKSHHVRSLSSRRAWIEMLASLVVLTSSAVALLTESVD